jgi:hypothetical protein
VLCALCFVLCALCLVLGALCLVRCAWFAASQEPVLATVGSSKQPGLVPIGSGGKPNLFLVLSAKSNSLLGRKESGRLKTRGSTTNRTNHTNENAEVF